MAVTRYACFVIGSVSAWSVFAGDLILHRSQDPFIATEIWHSRKPFSQWERSFHLKAALSLAKMLVPENIAGLIQAPIRYITIANANFII